MQIFSLPTMDVIASVVGLLLIYVAVRLAIRYLTIRIGDVDARYRVRKGLGFAGWFVAILFLASVFSDRLGGLNVSFGIIGAGIAFALQEVIASVAGWAAVSFGGFYDPGDRVELGGIKGDVIDIGILRTTLMEVGAWVDGDLYSGRIVRVANSFVFKQPVFNFSGEFPFLWDEIRLPVQHGSDYGLVREILERVAEEVVGHYADAARLEWDRMVRRFHLEAARLEPMVTMKLTENMTTFTLRYLVEYKRRRTVQDMLFQRVLEETAKERGRVFIGDNPEDVSVVAVPRVEAAVLEGEGLPRA